MRKLLYVFTAILIGCEPSAPATFDDVTARALCWKIVEEIYPYEVDFPSIIDVSDIAQVHSTETGGFLVVGKAKFQNVFGAGSKREYFCDFSSSGKTLALVIEGWPGPLCLEGSVLCSK